MAHVYEKLHAVEFDRLPERLQKAYLAPPLLSAPVKPEGDGFRLLSPTRLDQPAPRALVPKLGIKSWRDAGALGVIYEGVNMRFLAELLLQRPTASQRLAARAWTQTGLPLRLHLSPYVDLSEAIEARFLTNAKECRRISACLRGPSAQRFAAVAPRMLAFAREIAAHLPEHSHILDVGCLATGDIHLLEVNPALTPGDLAVLKGQ